MWKDVSSFSRDDKDRTPNEFVLVGFPRTVLHRHIHAPGMWFVSSHLLGIDRANLGNLELEEAKVAAVESVRIHLTRHLKMLDEAAKKK